MSLAEAPSGPSHGISLGAATRVWGRIATLSFGGPAGQIAMMHRELAEERDWVSEPRFLHALNYCMLLPGPEAQQLAIYIGWLLHGTRGGLIAGGLFVLPGMVALMALSWIYVLFGTVGWVGGLFAGLQAAVLVVVVDAVIRVGKRALRSPAAVGIAVAAFLALFLFSVPFPLVIGVAAVIGLIADRLGHPVAPASAPSSDRLDGAEAVVPSWGRAGRVVLTWVPLWLGPVAALYLLAGPRSVFTRLAVFFSEVAVVTFGGAYAVLAYVAQAAVQTEHWLTAPEMITGLGLAETTPGPLIMVVQHVGFLAGFHLPGDLPPLLAGTLAGLLVTWVTFAPCFLWVFLGAPYVEALRGARRISAALSAVTAAVVGVIANLALWFAVHSLFPQTQPFRGFGMALDLPVPGSLDLFMAATAVVSAVALFRFRLGVMKLLAACAMAGVLWRIWA